MGCVDEARRVVDGGNVFLTQQCEKLVVLARVGRRRTAGQNCGSGNPGDGANHAAAVADDAGKHGGISVLLKPSPDEPLRCSLRARGYLVGCPASGAGRLLSRSIRGASTTSRQGSPVRSAVCNVGTPRVWWLAPHSAVRPRQPERRMLAVWMRCRL